MCELQDFFLQFVPLTLKALRFAMRQKDVNEKNLLMLLARG